MNKKDYYDYREEANTRQVSLARLISTACRKNWMQILLIGVVLGVLLGGYQVVKIHRQKNSMNAAYEDYEVSLQQYNDSLDDYDASIADAQDQISKKVDYIENSPRMNLDPYNEAWAYVDLVFEIDEEDADTVLTNTGISAKLASIKTAYSDEINYGQVVEDTAVAVGMDSKSFKELINATNDTNSESIRVFIRATDEESAQQEMEAFLAALDRKKDAFEDVYGEYTMTVLNTNVITVYATDTSTFQSQQQSELSTLQTNLNNLKTQKSNLVAPERVQPYSRTYLLKEGMKRAVIGFVFGVAIAFLFYMIKAINRGYIFTADEIDGQYGLRNLINFSGRRDKREKAESDVDYALAQLETMENIKGVKTIALVGSVSEKRLSALTQMFSDKAKKAGDPFAFGYLPDILADADSMRGLRECDGYLLVEEIGRSNYNAVRKEIGILAESGKILLGTIYF